MQLIGANPTDQCLRNLQNGIAHGRTESNEKVKVMRFLKIIFVFFASQF